MEKRESIGGTAVTRMYATDDTAVTLVEWLDIVADADGNEETVADKGNRRKPHDGKSLSLISRPREFERHFWKKSRRGN